MTSQSYSKLPLGHRIAFAVSIVASLSACDSDNSSSNTTTQISDKLLRSDDFPGVTCQLVESEARDGTMLTGVLYLPENTNATGQPSIVHRTPYARLGIGTSCFPEVITNDVDAIAYAREGYAYLYQHVRGTYTSEGDFNIFRQEKNDGYDAVEWAADQSWSNGAVGIRGASYMGATAWQATIGSPPSLKAASISVSSEDYHREWVYENGIPHHSMNISWPELTFTSDQIIRQEAQKGTTQEDVDTLLAQRQQLAGASMWSDWVWQLPLTSLNVFDGYIDSYADWLAHPTYDTFWEELDVAANISDVEVPVMIHGAWYDIFANGSLETFTSVQSRASTELIKTGTKLLMTPYGHAVDHQTPTFGPTPGGAFAAPASDLNVHTPYDMAYFDKYLKGEDNGFETSATAQLYVMVPPDSGVEGSTFLHESDSYPLANTTYQSYYLSSEGDANDREGSGTLAIEAETQNASIAADAEVTIASTAADLFQYDPANPVPTMGGNLCCGTDWHPQGPQSGAVEQADVEVRDDVLVYTSEILTEDLVVIGPVSVQLFAKSSAVNTDFTAKLVDIRPDGQSHNILDAAVRASLRDGSKSTPSLIEAHRTYEYTINMGHTGVVFPAGHRIRLQISSSNFPKLARNLNTGLSNETTADMIVAEQVILHDADHPSRLVLPVVADVDVPE